MNNDFGLVLAGGGIKGAAHVGVLLALEEYGMLPNAIAGASAGSIVAGLYAAGFSPADLKNMVLNLSKNGISLLDPDILGILKAIFNILTGTPITLSGILKGNKLEKFLNTYINGVDIKNLNMKTLIPAVDISNGQTIAFTNSKFIDDNLDDVTFINNGNLTSIICASSAIPAIFKPKYIDNMCLVDGGVTDVLPVNLLMSVGVKNVLAIDVSKKYQPTQNANLFDILFHSYTIMGNRLRECTSFGEKLLINPNISDKISIFSFKSLIECMNAGYNATISSMEQIKSIF